MADKTIAIEIKVEGLDNVIKSSSELSKLAQAKKDQRRESELTAKAINAEEGSIVKLRAQTALLKMDIEKAGRATKEQREEAAKMEAQYKKNSEAIRNHDRNLSGSSTLIGEYEKGFSGAFKQIGNAVLAVSGIVAGASVIWKTFHNAISTSRELSEKLEAVMKGLEFATKSFFTALRTGDIAGFVTGLGDTVKRGIEYQEGLDRIEKRQKALNFLRTEEKQALAELDEATRNKSLTDEQRLANGLKLSEELKKAYDREKQQRSDAVEVELKALNLKGLELENAKALVQEYLRLDALNPKIREEAEKYNKAIEERNNAVYDYVQIGDQQVQIQRQRTKEELDQYDQIHEKELSVNEDTKRFAEEIIKLERNKGKTRVDAVIDALQKEAEVTNAFYYENRRIINVINSLKGEVDKNDAERNKETNEKKAKSDKEYFDQKMIDLEIEEKSLWEQAELEEKIYTDLIKAKEKSDDEYFKNKLQILQDEEKAISDKIEWEEQREKEKEEYKKRLQEQTFQYIGTGLSAISSLYEANKQRELSAAGDNAQKREAIEKEYLKKQQTISIAQALINGAQGISKIWAQSGILAPLFIAIEAASMFAQIAVIKAQKFATGGLLIGPSHNQGGIPLTVNGRPGYEAEGGEAIINKKSTAKYRSLLSRINQEGGGKKFAYGGILPEQSNAVGFDINRLSVMIASQLNSIRVVNSVKEFHEANSVYTSINTRSIV